MAIIEDDSSLIKLWELSAKRLGLEPVCFKNLEEAQSKLIDNGEYKKIDLFLCDYIIQDTPVTNLCQKLRKLKKEIPIIFVTGVKASDLTKEVGIWGNYSVLEKPVSLKTLNHEITKLSAKKNSLRGEP